jgi:hypothetical protein
VNEFDVKNDFGLKASLHEKLRKEFRSTPEMPKLNMTRIGTKTTLKGEEGKLKGYIWPQQ